MATSKMTLSSDSDGLQTQRIWLEVGHTYEPRYWQSGRAVPEDWRVWVRGVDGADISALVDRVVFELRPDTRFPYPKRIYLEAPYQHEGVGSAPDGVVVTVHLKCAVRPVQFRVKYGPLFRTAGERSAGSRLIFHDVENPSSQLLAMKAKDQSSGSGEVRARGSDEPEEPKLTHRQALLFEPCDICDDRAKSGGEICPKLAPLHDRVEAAKSPIAPRPDSRHPHRHRTSGKEPTGSCFAARRRCHRCLARGAPCARCRPRRPRCPPAPPQAAG